MNAPTPKSVVSLASAASAAGPDTEPAALPRGRAEAKAPPRAAKAPSAPPAPHSAFLPLLLGLLALLSWLCFQAWMLGSERSALQAAHQGQQQTVENAGKLRASLDGLAADTKALADTGNANAALLVAELKKRGITINANTAPTPAAAAPAPRAP